MIYEDVMCAVKPICSKSYLIFSLEIESRVDNKHSSHRRCSHTLVTLIFLRIFLQSNDMEKGYK